MGEGSTRRSLNERVLDVMVERLDLLTSVGVALSREQDPARLLEQILLGAKTIANADGGTLYEVDADKKVLRFAIMRSDTLKIALGGLGGEPIDLPPVPLNLPDGRPNHASVVAHAVLAEKTINIADAYAERGFDFSGTRAFDRRTGYRSRSMLTVPMRDHEGTIIGVLQLLNARAADGTTVMPFSRPIQRMVESLASQAAIAVSRHRLIEGMHGLFEAFVRLIAKAIDRKSPHTGAHCQRVPELTMLIAEAVGEQTAGPLAGIRMDADGRRELHIAALLHDCGKIATPDWVMEKATKLHTIYDRIGLIAVRVAAAKREAELAMLRAIQAGEDRCTAEAVFARAAAGLDDDLAFLKRVNIGAESMTEADRERVRAIARQTWRDAENAVQPLLTADEVENLLVVKGTLTEWERRVIQDHIRHTIEMLEALPYPKHLRRVPEFAGGHHERCDGKGYPRGLKRSEMSVQARIMAIADIFEALTAADRPYRKAMPLSRAFAILKSMRDEGHIDPDLYRVFVESRVWERYAAQYLKPEQIDAVRIEDLL